MVEESQEAAANGGPHDQSRKLENGAGEKLEYRPREQLENGAREQLHHHRTSGWKKVVGKTGLLGHSETLFDAWLTAATAQIGQVVVTLPYTLSQLGYGWGVACLIGFGLLGWWSVYLLSWLFFEYKAKLARQQKPLQEGRVMQYHEVIGGVGGRVAGYITFFFIIGSLFLAGVIQHISSASDLYYANDSLNKRQWAYVSGAISLLSIFLPTFSHFRGVAVLGVTSTTIAAIYLLTASLSHGQVENVRHTGPKDHQQIFTGVANTIFTFGGHGITIEVMHAMKRPSKFKYVYLTVVAYSLLVMLPSSVSVYWAYGDLLLQRANAFSLLPKSGWRTMAIACMVVHQSMVYIVIVVPIFIALEKAVGLHTGRYIWRTLVRIPVVLAIWFVALAIPFFALINSIMGAFIVTVGAYAIPPSVFFITYRAAAARESSVQQPPRLLGGSWAVLFIVNAVYVVGILVVGLGWGGWATISNLIDNIHSVGLFTSCYQCPPPKKA